MANFIPKFDREFRVGHASGGCSSSSNDERRCRRSESPSRPPPPQPLGHPLDRGHHPHHRALQPQVGAPRPHQPQKPSSSPPSFSPAESRSRSPTPTSIAAASSSILRRWQELEDEACASTKLVESRAVTGVRKEREVREIIYE
ncbi:Uncharacterized protein M6B38_242005 [Iris pallida]|uniref:Uncharacterized protein n=1 Tax=Iris pallida TaxID=29817 RepID=A0AAX6DK80_IRIPA|nr:Uncharacterized protein M6B38_242005 [Iris pallida]